jgi:hypothetical protein
MPVASSKLLLMAIKSGALDPRLKFWHGAHVVPSASEASWATAQALSHGKVAPAATATLDNSSRLCDFIG